MSTPFYLTANNAKKRLQEIPKEDKEALSKIFYRMMMHDHLVYTLFGDKPVSCTGDFTLTPCGNIMCGMQCGGYFWKNWEIWKKYESSFSFTEYLFIEEPPNEHNKSIYFINKKAFLNLVNRYLPSFQEVLGEKLHAEELLKRIEDNKDLFSMIKQNQALFGLLLGYGEHNPKLFAKRDAIRKFIKSKKLPSKPYKIPQPTESFSSLEEEHNFYFSKLIPFSKFFYSPIIVHPIGFVADPEHEETKMLQKKYGKLRGRISEIYSQGDFLEITLSQLTRAD